jgi:hypothetical protein
LNKKRKREETPYSRNIFVLLHFVGFILLATTSQPCASFIILNNPLLEIINFFGNYQVFFQLHMATAATSTNPNQKTPSDFLKLVLGRPVIVKLNSGVVYKGTTYWNPNANILNHIFA